MYYSVFLIDNNIRKVKKWLNIKTRQRLDEVIEDNLDYLVRFATLRLGNKADAEDVVYEAIRRILETDVAKVKKDSLRMYLFRIVYNLCQDYGTSFQEIRSMREEDNEIADQTVDADLDYEETERLRRLLDVLPEREAEVIRMNIMDELSFIEISQILSISPSTIKSRFKSGMEKLRKQYFKKQ